jgi:predicted transcriptional regulator
MQGSIWQSYGQVVASKYRRGIILTLYSRPMTPTEISKEMGVKVSHISRSLHELVQKQTVVCLTPTRKKGRVYSLTKKGRKIAKILQGKN